MTAYNGDCGNPCTMCDRPTYSYRDDLCYQCREDQRKAVAKAAEDRRDYGKLEDE